MAYQAGDDILDNEINGFIGSGGTAAYASQVAVDAAAPCVGAVYGVGFGNRGYGQSGITLTPVVPGQLVASTEWTNMRNALAVVREHQTGSVPALVPPTSLLETGDVIQAHETSPPSNDTYDFNSQISSADSSRFSSDSAKRGTFTIAGVSTETRTSAWSSTINHSMRIQFGSEDAARYFFNSGGQIRLDYTHPAGTPQDNDWRSSLITRLGQVRFDYTGTTTTGTSGLSSSIGYYDLIATFQTIINGANIGTGAYTTNDVLIEAQRDSFGGVNGANGPTVRIRTTLTDQHSNPFFDTVSAGTNVSYSVRKATFLSGIVTPTGVLFESWN